MTLQELIRFHSSAYNVDPIVVAGIICHESEQNRWACRYEEKWFDAKLLLRSSKDLCGWKPTPGHNPSLYDEKVWRAHSFGYMQVLGETARSLGFSGRYLMELLDPPVNIKFGCMILGKYVRRALNQGVPQKELYKKALLYYNGGGDPNYPAKIQARIDSGEAVELLTATSI
jgi:hypothetical protein